MSIITTCFSRWLFYHRMELDKLLMVFIDLVHGHLLFNNCYAPMDYYCSYSMAGTIATYAVNLVQCCPTGILP